MSEAMPREAQQILTALYETAPTSGVASEQKARKLELSELVERTACRSKDDVNMAVEGILEGRGLTRRQERTTASGPPVDDVIELTEEGEAYVQKHFESLTPPRTPQGNARRLHRLEERVEGLIDRVESVEE